MLADKDHKKSSSNTQGLATLKVIDGKYQLKDKKLGEGSFA